MVFESMSYEETLAFAEKMGERAKPGQVYALSGELGAGKTVFAKGLARGLGVEDDITSPTFCILSEYAGRLPLYHFDVYRIKSVDEMENIGYIEYFYGAGVCLVKWAELIEEILPHNAVFVEIKKDLAKGENYRRIICENDHLSY